MNKFKKTISSLLTLTFFFHTCAPAYALWDDIDDIEENKKILENGAIPGSLNFKADPKQTAAGCLFYAYHKGEAEVLLGFRDDQDFYCNPGGKSDPSDKGLHFTGGRESGEETFNIYAPHPEILKHKPFVDLYSTKEEMPFLNRMYFVEQEYIDAEIFNKRLEDPNLSNHQKEYRHFKWVPAKDLLHAVQNKQNTVKISEKEEIKLFEPLYQTLLTETSRKLLEHLVIDKMIPFFTPHKNRIHMVGVPNIDSSFKISWKNNFERTVISKYLNITQKLIKNEKEDRFVLGKAVAAKGMINLEIKRKGKQPVNFEKQRVQRMRLLELDRRYFEKNSKDFELKDQSQLNQPQLLPLKILPTKNPKNIPLKTVPVKKMLPETQLSKTAPVKKMPPKTQSSETHPVKKMMPKTQSSETVPVKKMMPKNQSSETHPVKKMMPKNQSSEILPIKKLPLKGLPPLKNIPLSNLTIEENISPTLSDLLLQVQLGEKYVKPLNPNDPRSRHEADVKNLKLYQEIYSKVEGELKRETKPLETDYSRLARVLELERNYKNWIPLHHASAPQIKYFWIAGTPLRKLLALEPVAPGTNPYMRTTDIYVRGLSTMEECLENFGSHDYEGKNASMRLCGNMAVTPGLSTTHTSSNSVEYFYNSHSVAMPNAIKRFEESTQLIGMTETSYLPYQSLYEQFFGCVSKDVPNSAWTIVFIKPELLDTYAYPAHGGGSPFYAESPSSHTHIESKSTKLKIPSAIGLYKQAREELTKRILSPSKEEISGNKFKKIDSIAEMRLLLDPSLMTDPNKVRVHSIDRFPLTKKQQEKFETQLTAVTINDVGRWLSQHTKLMKDSLYKYPVLKKLYALVHKNIVGEEVVETVSAEAFPHLIRNGHYEGAKQFLESYGDILKTLKVPPYDLALSALNSGSVETFKFVLQDVLKKSIGEFFSVNHIKAFVSGIGLKGLSPSYAYLFKNYNINVIEEKIRRRWGVNALLHGSADLLNFFHESIYPLTLDMLDEALSQHVSTEVYKLDAFKGLLEFKGFSKESVIETILKYFSPEWDDKLGLGYYRILPLLFSFIKEGFDYKKCLPVSGNPLLFYVPQLGLNPETFSEDKLFLTTLGNDMNLMNYKNKENLNIVQFMQKVTSETKCIKVHEV